MNNMKSHLRISAPPLPFAVPDGAAKKSGAISLPCGVSARIHTVQGRDGEGSGKEEKGAVKNNV